jgi:hypothetical protein
MKKITVMRDGRPATAEELNCAVEGQPLPPVTGSVNPELYRELAAELWGIERQMTRGCGNHGCRVQKPTGQATNASCDCGPRKLARRLRDIAERLSPNTDYTKGEHIT